MANTVGLSVANLDFDAIKSDLKTFLRGQTQFADYDFDGSNLSVLIDLLAYNTHFNSFYLNMIASESFLDSAQLRDAVVSHAKTLNYVPRSYRASGAKVDVTVTPTVTPESVVVPALTTKFTAKVDGVTYTFTTDESLVLRSSNAQFVASNVDIYEGLIVNESFVVDTSNTDQKFVISNDQADTSSLIVSIRNSTTDSTNAAFTEAITTLGLSPTSNVYFVQAADDKKYEILFGDNTLGRSPLNGNVIDVTYRVPSGTGPNGANSFTLAGNIDGHSNVQVTLVSAASGGAEHESIESVKFHAPRNIAIQERTITRDDYITLLQSQFPEIESVSVFGGEEMSPPQYGKVIVCVDVTGSDGVSDTKKTEISDFLKQRSPLSIEAKVLDPSFLYLSTEVTVRYNVNVTTQSKADISSKVSTAVASFANTNINDFSVTLRESKLLEAIDASDPSILGSSVDTFVYVVYTPTLGVAETKTFEFRNALKRDVPLSSNTYAQYSEPALTSTTFTFDETSGCSFRDDGKGVVQIVVASNSAVSVVKNSIGTIDYERGTVVLANVNVESFTGSGIELIGRPMSNMDITTNQNAILTLKSSDIEVDVTQESV